jgi:hypothetical protein
VFLQAATNNFQHHGLSRLSATRLNGAFPARHSISTNPQLMQKLESLASAAVRAASMTGSELIVVYTNTGEQSCGCLGEYRGVTTDCWVAMFTISRSGQGYGVVKTHKSLSC